MPERLIIYLIQSGGSPSATLEIEEEDLTDVVGVCGVPSSNGTATTRFVQKLRILIKSEAAGRPHGAGQKKAEGRGGSKPKQPRSRYSLEVCKEYTRARQAAGEDIFDPDALAKSLFFSGAQDLRIARYLASKGGEAASGNNE